MQHAHRLAPFGNASSGVALQLNIINLTKPDSLYNHGMRPLMSSQAAAKRVRLRSAAQRAAWNTQRLRRRVFGTQRVCAERGGGGAHCGAVL